MLGYDIPRKSQNKSDGGKKDMGKTMQYFIIHEF